MNVMREKHRKEENSKRKGTKIDLVFYYWAIRRGEANRQSFHSNYSSDIAMETK